MVSLFVMEKRKKDVDFCKGFKSSFDYLSKSKKYIYVMAGVFTFFILIGFFVSLPSVLSNQLLNYFQKLIEQTKNFGLFGMFLFLFKNNVLASFLGVLGGGFFGIFSFFNGILNGFVLGFASHISVARAGLFSLWKLFPHGVFELPALVISIGMGLKLGGNFLEKKFKVKGVLKQALFVFLIGIFFIIVSLALSLISSMLTVFFLSFSFAFTFYYFLRDEGG
jgi:stage II sporulation protein M